MKHFTIVNFAYENITIGKFVSSVSALIIDPPPVELIPVGKIHDTLAVLHLVFADKELKQWVLYVFLGLLLISPTYLAPCLYLMVARLGLDDWAKLLGTVNSKPIRVVSKSRRRIINYFLADRSQ